MPNSNDQIINYLVDTQTQQIEMLRGHFEKLSESAISTSIGLDNVRKSLEQLNELMVSMNKNNEMKFKENDLKFKEIEKRIEDIERKSNRADKVIDGIKGVICHPLFLTLLVVFLLSVDMDTIKGYLSYLSGGKFFNVVR